MTKPLASLGAPGIPLTLAQSRAAAILELRYELGFSIPAEAEAPIRGRVVLEFALQGSRWPLIDFAPGETPGATPSEIPGKRGSNSAITRLRVNDREAAFEFDGGRVAIAGRPDTRDRQRIEIDFLAGDAGLRRREALVYSLFVPAQAHKVFPCFDQPDLKARLGLELEVPAAWQALANAAPSAHAVVGERARFAFAETMPLPTYLFAFATGCLESLPRTVDGRRLELFYPPGLESQVAAHADEIFRLHGEALSTLEDYTGIAYPFEKFAFALVPDFDFGGMEHPGAVFYRAELLLLPSEAEQSRLERRASLIAHETAHMWFGNLVTMPWFDDVWLKEVFASFMADKVVAGLFPDTDRELGFVLAHFPPAYAIDRSEGTHAIREPLDNLDDAGERYDALIYHKAPIAITALEREIGATAMQRGLRRYLADYRYANADFAALRETLQAETSVDLEAFSARWLETAGPPPLADAPRHERALDYGLCELDDSARFDALERLRGAPEPAARARAWIRLYEDMRGGGLAPPELLTAALGVLEHETEALTITRVVEDLAEIYWRFLTVAQRGFAAGPVERVLRMRSAAGGEQIWLARLARFASTPEALATLADALQAESGSAPSREARGVALTGAQGASLTGSRGAPLPETLALEITCTLAVHQSDRADAQFAAQRQRLADPELRARLEFLAPALSADTDTRRACFDRLVAGAGRALWSVEALRLLCHPLRAAEALALLEPGIAEAERLRDRGDIFLPRQWLAALFNGHGTADAAAAIRGYLARHALPVQFSRLVLQTADPVFRAARIRGAD